MTDQKKSCRELYDVYRDYLKHEDGLINNRMTWLILSQSFFFTTFALAIGRLSDSTGATADQIVLFLQSVAVLGIVVGFATCLSIAAALNAIEGLRKHWSNHAKCEVDAEFISEKNRLPDLTGGGNSFGSIFGFFMPIVMPLIFVGTWFFILDKI